MFIKVLRVAYGSQFVYCCNQYTVPGVAKVYSSRNHMLHFRNIQEAKLDFLKLVSRINFLFININFPSI